MRYTGIPVAMWVLFKKPFKKNLTEVLGTDRNSVNEIVRNSLSKYKEIISGLPEFEKGDRFKVNIVSCAMLCSFVLSVPHRPDVEKLTEFYSKSMMTSVMKLFCRIKGRKKFSGSDIAQMKYTAGLKAGDRNPYSWNMKFYEYKDGNRYEARFTQCGICTLMKELGLYDLVPAMCRLDYTMSEAGGASEFVRKYTIASGGAYCDCGYRNLSGKPNAKPGGKV